MTDIIKDIVSKIKQTVQDKNLTDREVEELVAFKEYFQLAAEQDRDDFKDFEDFFDKKVKNNSSLAVSERESLEENLEAMILMRYFFYQ